MIEHTEFRELISARADGELQTAEARELDAHLASCATCSAFADGIDRLREAARTIPVERAPEQLAARVRRAHSRRPRLMARAIAAVAAALAIALVISTEPLAGFRLPAAQAARALTEITSLYVDREIRFERAFEPSTSSRVREKIWFRAPDLVRIERTTTTDGSSLTVLIVERGTERYVVRSRIARHYVNVPPDARSPLEPLSVTVPLLGKKLGDGPRVAGRATVRYEITVEGQRRVALIDAERFTMLGTEPVVILEKARTSEFRHTNEIRYNEPIADERFVIPSDAPRVDRGFEQVPVGELASRPAAIPEGFSLLVSGRSRSREHLVYGNGAFRIHITSSGSSFLGRDPGARIVSVGGTPAFVNIPLYGVPILVFEYRGQQVQVRAPMDPDDLALMASMMFPE